MLHKTKQKQNKKTLVHLYSILVMTKEKRLVTATIKAVGMGKKGVGCSYQSGARRMLVMELSVLPAVIHTNTELSAHKTGDI